MTKGRRIKSSTTTPPSSSSKATQDDVDVNMNEVEELMNQRNGKDKMKNQTALESLPEVYVICGSEDQRVYVWNLQTKKLVQTLIGHRDVVISVDVHPFLPVIASASLDQDPCIKVSQS